MVEEGRRRRIGLAVMGLVAGLLAVGLTVASYPSVRPTEAIPRAHVARQAILDAQALLAEVERKQDGQDLIDRAPEVAKGLLADANDALQRAVGAGIAETDLAGLRARVDGGLDTIYAVARLRQVGTVADLAAAYEDIEPLDMVVASDGSLWVIEKGRGRVVHIDPASAR